MKENLSQLPTTTNLYLQAKIKNNRSTQNNKQSNTQNEIDQATRRTLVS